MSKEHTSPELKKKLNIPADAFVIGASGKVSHRKGVDYFIEIARKIVKDLHRRPVRFVWVGGPLHEPFAKEIMKSIDDGSLNHKVIFTDIQKNPYQYYDMFDIFLLTSREEPFGMVVIEAGILKKTFLCFEGADGPKKFAEEGWGIVIKDFDPQHMADKARELLLNSTLRTKMGECAHRNVQKYYTAKQAVPKITHLIKQYADHR